MKRNTIILLMLASLCVGCSSTSYIATDDVYYWPDAHHISTGSASSASTSSTSSASSSSSTSSSSSASSASSESAPAVEYLNVQDTVVTIRVKK